MHGAEVDLPPRAGLEAGVIPRLVPGVTVDRARRGTAEVRARLAPGALQRDVRLVGHDAVSHAVGDLLDPVTGLLGEYDGSGHRAETQHALDNAREEVFEDTGLTVVRVSNPDLGRFRSRTRLRLVSGWRRAQRTPRGSWTWEPGPLPPPVPHW